MTKNQQTALSSGCDNYLHTECGYPDKCTCRCHKIDQIRGRQKWRANAQRQIGRSPEDSQSYSDIDFLLSENERLTRERNEALDQCAELHRQIAEMTAARDRLLGGRFIQS